MIAALIVGGLVAIAIAICILAAVFINYDGKGERASGERTFRPEKATPLALDVAQPGSYRDVYAGTFGRPWLHADLPPAPRYERHDRLALMAASFVPPPDVPVPASDRPVATTLRMSADALTSRDGDLHDSCIGDHGWVLGLLLAPVDKLAETGQRSLESFARHLMEAS